MKTLTSFITTTTLAFAVPVAADTFNSRFEVAARYARSNGPARYARSNGPARYAREKMLEESNSYDSTSNCCADSDCCSNSNCCSTTEPTPDNTYNNDGGISDHGSSDSP